MTKRAVACVLVLASAACSGAPAPATPGLSPPASATSPRSVPPTAVASLCLPTSAGCTGPLAAGTHSTGGFSRPFTFTVPDGWSKSLDEPSAFNLVAAAEPSGFLGVWPDLGAANQEACTNDLDPGVGRAADNLVMWLADHPELVTTEPEPATIGGLPGKVLDVEKDPSVSGPCPNEVGLFTSKGTIVDFGWVVLRDDFRARTLVLDAGNGHTVVVYVEAEKAAFDTFAELTMPVVNSFEFRQ